MEKISLWNDTTATTAFPQGNGDRSVYLVIIGGGITGTKTAGRSWPSGKPTLTK